MNISMNYFVSVKKDETTEYLNAPAFYFINRNVLFNVKLVLFNHISQIDALNGINRVSINL